jgi:hypothetical protein
VDGWIRRIWSRYPRAQHVVVIVDAVEVNAGGLDHALEGRHEVQSQPQRIGSRQIEPLATSGRDNLLVFQERRHPECAVNALVVHASNEFGQPAVALLQRHAGVLLRIVVAAFGGVRLRCSRNTVDLRGKRSEQPFNVSAVVRLANRPMLQTDAVLLAGAFECLAMELAAVIAMHASHKAVHGPVIR